MDKKTTGIVSYITFIGWLVAFFAGDREGAKFQLNQTLVLTLASLINNLLIYRIPVVGGIACAVIGIALFVLWIIGLVGACKGTDTPMPLISEIKILK